VSIGLQFFENKVSSSFPLGKSPIERIVLYIQDRTVFDDCFPCSGKKGDSFPHVKNWLGPFATMYNKENLNAWVDRAHFYILA
jgi:hypothetical protein